MKRSLITILLSVIGLSISGQDLEKIDSLKGVLSSTNDGWTKVEIYNRLSSEMMNINIHLAKNYVDTAIQMGQRSNYRKGLGMAFHNAGIERWLNGYYSEAESYYHLSIGHHTYLNDSARLASNYSYLGLSFHYHSEYDSALHYHYKSKSINEALNNQRSVAHNLDNIALAYHQLGDFSKVIEYSSKALEIRSELPGYSSRTNLYNYGGQVFNQKAFEESISYYKIALHEELEKGDNQYRIGQTYNNLGSTFYTVGIYDSAVFYLRKSAEIIRKINIPNRYAGQLNELGEALRELGYLNEAEKVFQECLQLWDSVGHRTSQSIIRNNLAKNYLKIEDYNMALIYINAAIKKADQMQENPFLIDLGFLKSEVLLKLNRLEEASEMADKTLKTALRIDVKNSILKGYDLLGRIKSQMGDQETALLYMNKYTQLKDSLYNGESSLQLAQMQVTYETDKKNKEIELLNTQNIVQQSEIKSRNVILILSTFGFLLLSFGLFKRQKYIRRLDFQKAQIEQQNLELTKSNHEKNLLLGEVHHRVKNNLQIVSSILNLQSRRLADQGAKDALKKGQNRVKAMAMIHQQLYKKDEFASLNVHDYLLQLVRTIGQSYGYDNENFDLVDKIENIYLDLDSSVKLGLITNEIITNVFKHAFDPSKENLLKVLLQEKEGTILLQISDNGPGANPELFQESDSFGIFLVKNLVEDMDGELNFENRNGLSIQLVLSSFENVSRLPVNK